MQGADVIVSNPEFLFRPPRLRLVSSARKLGIMFCLCPAMAFAAGDTLRREGPSSLNPAARQSLLELSVTLERPLFAPSRARPEPPAPVPYVETPPPPPPAPPSVALVGVLRSADATRAVLRENATEKITHVRVGDTVGGWTVTAITARHLILSLEDRTKSIALFEGQPPKPAFESKVSILTQ